jgi:hypothetical protein
MIIRSKGGRGFLQKLCVVIIAVNILGIRTVNAQQKRIGLIAFFGQEGFDTARIRHALPFHEGDFVSLGANEKEAAELRDRWKESTKQALRQVIGGDPTDVELVCCSSSGDVLVYIGLPGKSYRPVHYNPRPKGSIRLPLALVQIDDEVGSLLMKAIMQGRGGEDDSEGYALSKDDPPTRSKQLEFRDEARKNEQLIFKVLESSADAEQRALAAEALGYVHQTPQQIAALVKASFDLNDEVRNNSARALGVLLNNKPDLRRQIPIKRFIAFLNSGTWTDRNKGLMVCFAMAQGRDRKILADLHEAEDSLVEMAQWYKGHAFAARLILGWIAGIEDQKLRELADEDPPDTLLRAFTAATHPAATR